ncbi:hypothetical protein [Nocardia asteroides]|uniref:hypothetical protein n=1 Tax=Nocardia asteroides TaxID=1824 RepID=UPI001E44B350|nr:hypothetical protein [Nocardia asteroides]UGT59244.1 hypothetical protein LTT61_18345 [Nocardia asteroides]
MTENQRPGEPRPGPEILTVTPRRGIARTTAIVLAGTASIALTAAAGAYVVNNLPDRTPGTIAAAPARPEAPAAQPVHRPAGPNRPFISSTLFERRDTAAIAGTVTARPETTETTETVETAEVVQPALRPEPPAAPEPAVDRTVRVGSAYLEAHVGESASGGMTLTVDTNATFAALTGGRVDPRDVTTLRTEVGTGGSVTVTFSDPTLGDHDLRLERTEVPARVTT